MAAERSPSGARADGARRSVAVPNGEGVASGSVTDKLKQKNSHNNKKEFDCFFFFCYHQMFNYLVMAQTKCENEYELFRDFIVSQLMMKEGLSDGESKITREEKEAFLIKVIKLYSQMTLQLL